MVIVYSIYLFMAAAKIISIYLDNTVPMTGFSRKSH